MESTIRSDSGSLEQIFSGFSKQTQIESEAQQELNEIESRMTQLLAAIRSSQASYTNYRPTDLHLAMNTLSMEARSDPLMVNYREIKLEIEQATARQMLKDRLIKKLNEQVMTILMVEAYFKSMAHLFGSILYESRSISHCIVSTDSIPGIILTPVEIESILGLENINYVEYLMSLLNLVDIINDYTTQAIINVSGLLGSSPPYDYSIAPVNLRVVRELQKGFESLDLKNDAIRRKYDSLKYNVNKLKDICYDLSVRRLTVVNIEIS